MSTRNVTARYLDLEDIEDATAEGILSAIERPRAHSLMKAPQAVNSGTGGGDDGDDGGGGGSFLDRALAADIPGGDIYVRSATRTSLKPRISLTTLR